jgi:CheY-like chemotaxis protein
VLIVEDVALIRMTTMEMAEGIGFEVLGAADGREALALLQAEPQVAVLLTDLGLPDMTGRQLVEKALALKPGLKVIVASGYREEDMAHVAFLRKPFDLQQLRKALNACAPAA